MRVGVEEGARFFQSTAMLLDKFFVWCAPMRCIRLSMSAAIGDAFEFDEKRGNFEPFGLKCAISMEYLQNPW